MQPKNTKGIHLSFNGPLFLLANLLLAICMTIGSVFYQRNPEPACHGAGLGAGFPLPFVCDDSGGSPISSWGKIDQADIAHVNPRVFLLDFLLYNALVTLVGTAVLGLLHKTASSHWALTLCITFLLAFIFLFLSSQSGKLDFEVPPPGMSVPSLYTPTPLGTTPVPTVALP